MSENKYVNLIRPRHTLILTPEQSNYDTDTFIKRVGVVGAGIRRRRRHAVLKTKNNSLNTDAMDSGYYSLNEKRVMGEV